MLMLNLLVQTTPYTPHAAPPPNEGAQTSQAYYGIAKIGGSVGADVNAIMEADLHG